jgi:hypothetical protein
MQNKRFTQKLSEDDCCKMYLAALSSIQYFVKPLPFTLNTLHQHTQEKILKELNTNDTKNLYIIYNFYTASIMKLLGEPISYELLYPIWYRRYSNEDILEDLVFQKVEAHRLHKIQIKDLL